MDGLPVLGRIGRPIPIAEPQSLSNHEIIANSKLGRKLGLGPSQMPDPDSFSRQAGHPCHTDLFHKEIAAIQGTHAHYHLHYSPMEPRFKRLLSYRDSNLPNALHRCTSQIYV
jgi:hypothetical protein